MDDSYVVYLPEIIFAAFTPSITTINSKVVLEVFAEDIQKALEPFRFYSNELYSGEV